MKKITIFLFAIISIVLSTSVGAQDKSVNQAIDEALGDHTKYEAVIQE